MPGKTESAPTTLELNRTEAQILARLVVQNPLAKERICALVTRAHQPIKLCSVGAIVHGLRKKLIPYGIRLDVVRGFGFALCREDRAKVLELLARPKPTITPKHMPTGATEATGANFRQQGRIEPEERPDAA
jgi:hypothetical protein